MPDHQTEAALLALPTAIRDRIYDLIFTMPIDKEAIDLVEAQPREKALLLSCR